VASLINVCAWLTSLLFPNARSKMCGAPNRDAWVAGSLAPHAAAVPVDAGMAL